MALVLSGDSPSLSGTYQGGAITSGTYINTTSGTTVDFNSIPSWVKRITLIFAGVSTNGTSTPLVQIGAGSVTTTGYTSSSAAVAAAGSTGFASSTAGFIMNSSGAANTVSGHMVLTTEGSNIWVASHTAKYSSTFAIFGGGDIILAGTLDRVRITTTNGTDAFDAGFINILYE